MLYIIRHPVSLLLIIMNIGPTHGQSYLELFGGYNYSDYYTSEDPHLVTNFKSYGTYLIGINYAERQQKIINLKLGLDYLYRKFNLKIDYHALGGASYSDLQIKLHSINFRILPNFTFGTTFRTSVYAGPYFELVVGGYEKGSGYTDIYTDSLNATSWTKDAKIKDEFVGGIGLMAGVSIEVLLPKNLIIISSVNYSYGLGSLSTNEFSGEIGKLNSQNLFFTLGMAYTLNNFTLKGIFRKDE